MESASLHDATRSTSCPSERSHQITVGLGGRSLNWRLILALLTNVAIWSLLLRGFTTLDR